jgi:hypothetical protein
MVEPVEVDRMQRLVAQWERASDDRAVFLKCYLLMTQNMLSAVNRLEFEDGEWVRSLLVRFAQYYFIALESYEQDPATAPAVWQQAHGLAADANALALQKLMAGVNAHINYDLVLTLVDVLDADWESLSADQRSSRYNDHCLVNAVISRTIDAVQDHVLEPASPWMAWVDDAFGRMDESLISRLISQWREAVWHQATEILESTERDSLLAETEKQALKIASRIA